MKSPLPKAQIPTAAFLEGFRALDLTTEQGLFCGKVLADLGVDVVKIEKPGGDEARRFGPFRNGKRDVESSISWFALNAGKRGMTLDIETERGREVFRQLVRTADFVIESFAPGHMDSIGLGYESLSRLNPKVIVTSITPFGQRGPYSGYKGSDLVLMSLGGYVYLNGDADRPPVRISHPQAYYHAGAEAAAATMIAHHHRQMTGEGQHVDVSVQESVVSLLLDAHVLWDASRWKVTRQGTLRVRPTGALLRTCWPCKDGHVGFFLLGGIGGGGSVRRLIEWLIAEGCQTEGVEDVDWVSFDWSAPDRALTQRAQDVIGRFFAGHTKVELYGGAIERSIWLFPVATTKDVHESPQLAARGFWQQIEYSGPEDIIQFPGSFVKGAVPEVVVRGRAPRVGEHNQEVFSVELGLTDEDISRLKRDGVV